jgi:hypothetical protein
MSQPRDFAVPFPKRSCLAIHPSFNCRVFAQLNSTAARRATLLVFAATLVTFAAIPVVRCALGRTVKDYELWYDAGRAVVHAQDLYPKANLKFPFMYPPSCAIFLAPLSLLGRSGMVVALTVVNGAAWVASILLSVRLVTGRVFGQRTLLYVLPSLATIVFVWGNFFLGQPSLLLLALLLGSFLCLQIGRQWGAGALIAIAAAIKAFPIVALVYLVYRRYWIASISAALSLLFLLVVLPAPFRGADRALTDLKRWSSGMFRYDATGVAQRPARSNTWKNQSIFGVANRLLRAVDINASKPPDAPIYANIATLSFKAVNAIIAGSVLSLGLIYIAAIPARRHQSRESDALEFALLLLMMLMLTPLSFGYLFVWLLYPFAAITGIFVDRTLGENRCLMFFVLPAVALLVATIAFPRATQIYGSIFFATLLLFVGLVTELWKSKTPARAQVSATG